jgi:hypothetical protein
VPGVPDQIRVCKVSTSQVWQRLSYVRNVPEKIGHAVETIFFCWNYFFATGHYVETSFENTDSELEGVLSRQMFFMFEDVGVRAIAVLF